MKYDINRLHLPSLWGSLIAGIVMSLVNYVLYNELKDIWARPLLIAVLLLLLAIAVCIVLHVCMRFTNESCDSMWFMNDTGPLVAGFVVGLVILFLLGFLFDWLYALDKDISDVPTSYVFLLDESGSMEGNDSAKERYPAINTLLETMPEDFPYAVYMFSNDVQLVRPLAPISDGLFQVDKQQHLGGGTELGKGLETILKDIGTEHGLSPRVIVLTDGYASDLSVFQSNALVDKYVNADVSISAVGLGDTDTQLLEHLSGKTGGSYVHIDKSSDLALGFATVAVEDASRDLLSLRNIVSLDFLYGTLRVLFLTALAAVIALLKAIAVTREETAGLVILIGSIGALIGALALELLLPLGIPLWFPQTLYWLLVAITPVILPGQATHKTEGSKVIGGYRRHY